MNPKELSRLLKQQDKAPVVLDVRSTMEFRRGHIPGSIHFPIWGLLFKRRKLPENRDQLIVVTCEHGPRAQMAAGLLQKFGYSRVQLLDGHMSRWRRENLPTER